MIELILGGARSGKSSLAEQRAHESGLSVTCIVTAESRDSEMSQRIAHHRQQRRTDWCVCEEPIKLSTVLQQTAQADCCIIVDCMTLWLTNLLCSRNPDVAENSDSTIDTSLLDEEINRLWDALPHLPGRIIMVSNEVGLSVVPLGALTRCFVDEQGRLNQRLAQLANRVTLVVAGLPMELKV